MSTTRVYSSRPGSIKGQTLIQFNPHQRDLSSINLTEPLAKEIASIPNVNTVKHLDFMNCDLFRLSGEGLATILATIPSSVKTVSLSGNQLSLRVCQGGVVRGFSINELAKAFPHIPPTVEEVYLYANGFETRTDEELITLINSLPRTVVKLGVAGRMLYLFTHSQAQRREAHSIVRNNLADLKDLATIVMDFTVGTANNNSYKKDSDDPSHQVSLNKSSTSFSNYLTLNGILSSVKLSEKIAKVEAEKISAQRIFTIAQERFAEKQEMVKHYERAILKGEKRIATDLEKLDKVKEEEKSIKKRRIDEGNTCELDMQAKCVAADIEDLTDRIKYLTDELAKMELRKKSFSEELTKASVQLAADEKTTEKRIAQIKLSLQGMLSSKAVNASAAVDDGIPARPVVSIPVPR